MPVLVDEIGVPAEDVEEAWCCLVLADCDAWWECAVVGIQDKRGFCSWIAAEVFRQLLVSMW